MSNDHEHYYVHKYTDDDGDHEVHTKDCSKLPKSSHREYVGYHDDCDDAVEEAEEKGYVPANGCFFCSRECHTS